MTKMKLPAHIRACIFDLDGTLADSMWMWHAIDVEFLGRYGLSCPEDLQAKIEGMSFHETAEYFASHFPITLSTEEMKNTWVRMAEDKYRHEVPLKPGAKEFLDMLRAEGMILGIATSNERSLTETVLGVHGIRSYFRVIQTGGEVKVGKPAPDIYLRVASLLGVPPDNCAVFEDIIPGILSGKRAGMTVYAVSDAYSAGQETEKRRLADGWIEDYHVFLPK